jgi:hypothetical protein
MARSKANVARPRCCWGAQIQCVSADLCTPRFVAGPRHFKTKFCANCRQATAVSVRRIRALDNGLELIFRNNHQGGLWTPLPDRLGGGKYRVINHSKGCIGPSLVVFAEAAPSLEWPPLPEEWISEDGHVHLFVSKGTLVPTQLRRRCMLAQVIVPSALMQITVPVLGKEGVVFETGSGEDEEVDEDEEMLTLEEVLRASEPPPVDVDDASDHFALAPLAEVGNDSSDSGSTNASSPVDEEDQKRIKRMMRNRQSAAVSRERKRRYIESLEDQVDRLTSVVKKLCAENSLLRVLDLCPEEEALLAGVLSC